MKVIIQNDSCLPNGEYELTDRNKLENAKNNIPFGSSDRQVLIEYDRIAGRVVKDVTVLPSQSLWNLERQQMNKSIEQFTDGELLTIIRRAENSNVPGSLYQRAYTEWQIRQQNKMLEASKENKNGIFFEVGGDMTNHGVIQTAEDSIVDIAVAGNYSSNKNTKIIQSDSKAKKWYERPTGIIILAVASTLIAGGVLFWLGWN